uniref:BigA/YdbA N-terminal beta-barrel domain-containing protein n=1 Tax=Citrobacter portucalensis TaxID=1639133 RepID=UPI001BD2D7AB
MQRKKLIAVGIAIALQTYYVPAIAADNDDDSDCPANISVLSKQERDKLSARCLAGYEEQDNHWGWVAGGVAALAAGVAIGIDNNGGGHSQHNNTPILPPDDGGDVTPVPPDDGGDVTPPDDGGDVTPVPPDDGGDVTPPDDGGDVTPVPPDDGGDVTPPDDGDDVTPVPPDDGGDVTPPDDGGDTPTPPDDTTVTTFSNGVTLDKGKNTLAFDDIKLDDGTHLGAATLSYAEKDGQWQLTTADGKTLNVTGWNVTDTNAAVIEGTQQNGNYWKYDSEGYLILANDQTTVVTGDDKTHQSDRDAQISGDNNTGVIISGDRTNNTLSGDSTVTDGATGIVITGDNTTNTISGKSTVDGGTGALISGDGTNTTLAGDITVSGGGTAIVLDGDNITVDNSGISHISGAGSTGAIITGDNAHVSNEGELTITDGGTGSKITGDGALVDNKGNSTTSGEGSTGLYIDGNDALVINEGDQTISGGAAGTKVDGDNTRMINTGDLNVDGAGSAGVTINGDNANITQRGDLLVTNGAVGIATTGKGNKVTNAGKTTVRDADSVGFEVTGEQNTFNNKGDITVSQKGTGLEVTGINNSVENKGDIYTTDAGSTGISIDGDNSQFANNGSLNVTTSSTGIDINGAGSNVNLMGTINVKATSDDGLDTPDGLRFANGNGFIGVNINAQNTQDQHGELLIDGDINVSSERDNPNDWPDNSGENPAYGRDLAGVMMNGDFNDVHITGSVSVDATPYHLDLATGISAKGTQYQDNVSGIIIDGQNNTVTIDGGVDVSSAQTTTDWTAIPVVTGIDVSGSNNMVVLNGESSITARSASNTNIAFANISNSSSMYISEGATLNIDSQLSTAAAPLTDPHGIINISSQSTLVNDGNISGHYVSMMDSSIISLQDSAFTNDTLGTIDIDVSQDNTAPPIFFGIVQSDNSQVSNKGSISLTASDFASMTPTGVDDHSTIIAINSSMQFSAIELWDDSSAINEGTISTSGGNTWGILLTDTSTAENKGTINHEGVWKDQSGNNLNCDSDITRCFVALGGGMVVTDTAVGTNTGTINVVNAGTGMWANGSGSTAINQGEINLTSNESVGTDTPYLIGMAATNGGTVINDKTGTINIDASYGQPFYADASSTVINYGQVCFGDNCQNSEEYNPTDEYVSSAYFDGLIADTGETVDLAKNTSIMGDVGNNGTVNGDLIVIKSDDYTLTNNASGTINNKIEIDNGTLDNKGTVNSVTLNGGTFNNTGTVDALVTVNNGTFNNLAGGEVNRGGKLSNNAVVNNSGTWSLGYAGEGAYASTLDLNNHAVFNNSGELIIDNAENSVNFRGNGRLYNTGHIVISDAKGSAGLNVQGNTGVFINAGVVDTTAKSVMASAGNADAGLAFFWNQQAGIINYDVDNGKAVSFTHNNYVAQNDGTMNISGNNAYGMYGSKNAQLVNNGTINLGTEGTTDTGMVAMALDANATADAVIENNGTINIHASDSYAFSVAGAGHVVNNGIVDIDDDVTGSGLIKQGDSVNVEGTNGNNGNATEVHYADYTLPDVPDTTVTGGNSSSSSSGTNDLTGYVVGTSADGSAGQLKVSNASMNGVEINTGFTAGTADTTATFDNVVQGSNLTDASAIQSTTVVWNAQGSQDADGNVDVTMTKNAYTDVATDSSVSDVASALDAGYTNNELYTSLNVGTTAELNSALKQVSGSQATTAFREARVLSNRFTMLADAAPQIKDGLAFNVVAKGDPRAELGNDTQYDMLALRQSLDLTASQNLTLEYGIARLDGDGSEKAGDNGLTGGYSQFFGLKHSMAFDEGLAWNNSLRYDVHNLDSSRSVSYGDTNKVADSDARQQYLEFRSEGAKTFTLMDDALKVTPYAGVKFRHTLEGGYKERSAGDFNLSMNAGSETAVDSIVGMKFDYTGENGWSASATLEGGPNLSYSKSQRTASLQGAAGQSFGVDDEQKGGGINGLATVGVKYSAKDASLNLDAYQWKEDNISDKGFICLLYTS